MYIPLYFRYADHVSVGDAVLVQSNAEFTPTKVLQVSSFTKQGSIFVTDLLFCSCY